MNDIIGPILQWMNSHPHFAGIITFIISAAESIAIIGTIIPGSVTMTAIGTLAGAGVIPLWSTIIWAILGAIVGDGISFMMGRYFNTRLPYMWPFKKHPALLSTGEAFFTKYGWMSVFIGRFVGPVRALVPLVAGMMNMPTWRFYVANILSAIGWAPAYMLPGILLGAASLELPADIAIHAILVLLMIGFLIALGVWLFYKFCVLISSQVNTLLTNFWNRLGRSKYFRVITKLLKHHDPRKTHGQLTLTFYLILTVAALLSLVSYINHHPANTIPINNALFHFFRSLRGPHWDPIFLGLSFFGDKKVLLPIIVTLSAWLVYVRNWRLAVHVLLLGFLTAAGVQSIKLLVHSPRPWGLLHNPESYSFPSGHTTLAVTMYIGIALLFIQLFKIRRYRYILTTAILFVALVSMTRMYLGVHWFTDVLAGWLLGTAVLMVVTLSYNRKAEAIPYVTGIVYTIFITLVCTYSLNMYLYFGKLKDNFQMIDWPTYTISENTWWNQINDHTPLYRINRFGLSQQLLNLQWLSNLDTIKTVLLKNGWETPPERNWINALHRITDVQSGEHLPLVSPVYLDKPPVLTLVKHFKNKLIVLRLWDSNVNLKENILPLWVGSVEVVPRTYSWLFKHKFKTYLPLSPTVIFQKTPHTFDIRIKTLKTSTSTTQTIILIKPKG